MSLVKKTPASPTSKLNLQDFFHGKLRVEFVEDRLEKEGDFLVRKSEDGTWVLSVRCRTAVRHIQPDFVDQGLFTYDVTNDEICRHSVEAFRKGSMIGCLLASSLVGLVSSRHEKKFGLIKCQSFEDLIKEHFQRQLPVGPDKAILKSPVNKQKIFFTSSDITVISQIGTGSASDVFKVKIESEGRFAAMKVLKADVNANTRESFNAELNMMISVKHPNIVTFVGVVQDGKQLKLLTELVNMGSLDKLLKKRLLSATGKLRVLTQVARGLQYLHGKRIIHRDMAARNVLINRNDDDSVLAKVSDFGLSRTDDEGRHGYELKSKRLLPLKWMAPETFTNRCWTTASDVWSYGVFMWEVFTDGDMPYCDRPELAAFDAIARFIAKGGHPRELQGIHPELNSLMMRCWAINPAERPKMEDIVKILDNLMPAIAKQSGTG